MKPVKGNEWQVWRDLLEEAAQASGPGRTLLYHRAVEQLSDSGQMLAQQAEFQHNHAADPELVELLFRRGLHLEPDNSSIRLQFGNWLADQGRASEAERELRQAVELLPDSIYALVSLGSLLAFDLGRPQEAEPFYQRAIDLHPYGGVSGPYACFLYWFKTDPENARVHFEKAIEYNSEDAEACANYARMLIETGGDLTRAEELFEWSLDLCFDAEVAADFADFLAGPKGDRAAADREYRQAMAAAPNHAELNKRYAKFLAEAGG